MHRLLSTYPFLKGYLLAAVVVTCVLGGSAIHGILQEDAKVTALAKTEARTSLSKDRTFRLWAARHGGLYVPVGPNAQPNPYLKIANRDIQTPVGILTLRNGATILSELSRNNPEQFGLKTRITALQHLNPENKPDPWEATTLRRFSKGLQEYAERTDLDGKPYLRMMQAMLMEKSCFKCHSDLGIPLGGVRGATGVAVPLAPYLTLRDQAVNRTIAGHGLIWLLAMIGMGWSARISVIQKDERRQSRKELEQRESEVRLLLNSVSEGIIGVDLQGNCIFVNPAALTMLGYCSPEQLIGANFHAVAHHTRMNGTPHHNEDCPTTHALLHGISNKEPQDVFWRSDGSSIPVAFSSHPTIESGQVTGAVITFNDISEQLNAEQHITMLSQGLEHSANGVIITNDQGIISYTNISFSSMTGYGPNEAKGRHPGFLGTTSQGHETYQAIKSALMLGQEWRGEFCARRKNGELFWVLSSISPIHDHQRQISHFIINLEDISDRKDSEVLIEHLAYYDPLTDLPNRRMMQDRLDLAMKRSRRLNSPTALLYIDLDRFKQVNDTLGHQTGDLLLIEMSQRLQAVLREDDTICRLGGDEFAVILNNIQRDTDAALVADKLVEQAAFPFVLGETEVFVGASIGIALYPKDAADVESLVKHADIALYHAKEQGRSTYCFYNCELNEANSGRLALESSLRHALERSELSLVYQPKIDLASGSMVGVEALLRWNSPEHGTVSPARFIPLAEETRQIMPIGEWVLKTACCQQVAWQQQGLSLTMAVNLSAVQFHTPNLIERIAVILDQTGIDPANLELELTESALVHSPAEAAETLENLRKLGVGIAIDDFGTGYSSLSYLKRFPVTTLKIDQSFVRDLARDSGDRAIAQSVVALGSNLSIKTVAEGVENLDQSVILKTMGCDLVQGFLYSRPLLPEQIPLAAETICSVQEHH